MRGMAGASAANAVADGVLREVLLGAAADVADAGLVDGRRGCTCLGVDAAHGAKLGDAVGALSCTLLAALLGAPRAKKWPHHAAYNGPAPAGARTDR